MADDIYSIAEQFKAALLKRERAAVGAAREMLWLGKEELAGNLTRALRISRTETLRAYREATHRTYQQNSDVIEGWYWLASLSSSGRTCAARIALHGTFHANDERMKTQVNCRCAQLPAVIGQPSPIKQSGSEWERAADVLLPSA